MSMSVSSSGLGKLECISSFLDTVCIESGRTKRRNPAMKTSSSRTVLSFKGALI
jgi:hypothetical protein